MEFGFAHLHSTYLSRLNCMHGQHSILCSLSILIGWTAVYGLLWRVTVENKKNKLPHSHGILIQNRSSLLTQNLEMTIREKKY